MAFLGTWQIDDVLTFPANTHTAATGAATDADSVPSYRVYEDETGTAILNGSMAKLDDANTTGFYSEQITLSAANGFEVGKCYTIYVSATVATVVGTMAHTFQVELAPLTPTVAGRTLDVSAGGEAGVDWANVGSPTTAVNLSATNIDTDQVVASVTGAVGSVTGAVGSVTGAVASVTGNVGGNVAGSVGSVTGAVGSVTGNVGGNVTGSVGSVAAGGITASSIATGAVDADALAADAVAEIQSGLATAANVAAVETDTQDIQSRLPAALVSGRIDASVGAMAADVVTASAVATGAIDAAALASDAVAEIADGVWDEATAGHATAGSTGAALTAAGSAGDPWSTALPGAYSSGAAGNIIGNIVASLSAGTVTVVSPVRADGSIVEIVAGDDYNSGDYGRDILWTFTGAPNLTGATVTWEARRVNEDTAVSYPVTVVTGASGGASQSLRLPMTAAQSAALGATALLIGDWRWSVEAVLASSGRRATILRGVVPVIARPSSLL